MSVAVSGLDRQRRGLFTRQTFVKCFKYIYRSWMVPQTILVRSIVRITIQVPQMIIFVGILYLITK
jgi:hypothetical protein